MVLSEKEHDKYVKWIWAYLLLFIFEGALRKWVLPGLSTPLLMIRTPIALYVVYLASKTGGIHNSYAKGLMIIGSMCFFTALLFGHHDLFIAFFGWQNYFIHFPFIVIASEILTREDVIKMGRWILWISVPMTALIIIQFYSPQSAPINIGVGGIGSSGFGGALGYYRPSGTFSFTSGYTAFQSIVCSFLLFFFLENDQLKKQQQIKKFNLYLMAFAYILSMPYSISRSIIFTTILIVGFTMLCSIRNLKNFRKFLIVACILSCIGYFALKLGYMEESMNAITTRFEQASKAEGGIIEGTFWNRFVGGFYNSLYMDVPILGYGLGIGTNAGAHLIRGNMFSYFNGESGFGMIIGEVGPILGVFLIYSRLAWAISLFRKGVKQRTNILGLTLLPTMCLTLATGAINAVPMMGYLVCISFLGTAALKQESHHN